MIPIRDNIPAERTPVVNYILIGICSIVFLLQVSQGDGGAEWIEKFGMIPARVSSPGEEVEVKKLVGVQSPQGMEYLVALRPASPSPVPPWATLLTCIFLHGGWMHAIGNLWFLHIFGDNVEDRMGHLGYLIFYLGCGVAASAAHYAAGPQSNAPTIGASGAIAGVMGAYLLLYPHAKVMALIPIVIFMHMMVVPAPLFLVVWFGLQFFQGAMSVANVESGGVAWWAHIGGFAIGALAVLVLKAIGWLNPAVTEIREHTEKAQAYRVYPRRYPPV